MPWSDQALQQRAPWMRSRSTCLRVLFFGILGPIRAEETTLLHKLAGSHIDALGCHD